jgi:hypothetical protein
MSYQPYIHNLAGLKITSKSSFYHICDFTSGSANTILNKLEEINVQFVKTVDFIYNDFHMSETPSSYSLSLLDKGQPLVLQTEVAGKFIFPAKHPWGTSSTNGGFPLLSKMAWLGRCIGCKLYAS